MESSQEYDSILLSSNALSYRLGPCKRVSERVFLARVSSTDSGPRPGPPLVRGDSSRRPELPHGRIPAPWRGVPSSAIAWGRCRRISRFHSTTHSMKWLTGTSALPFSKECSPMACRGSSFQDLNGPASALPRRAVPTTIAHELAGPVVPAGETRQQIQTLHRSKLRQVPLGRSGSCPLQHRVQHIKIVHNGLRPRDCKPTSWEEHRGRQNALRPFDRQTLGIATIDRLHQVRCV